MALPPLALKLDTSFRAFVIYATSLLLYAELTPFASSFLELVDRMRFTAFGTRTTDSDGHVLTPFPTETVPYPPRSVYQCLSWARV